MDRKSTLNLVKRNSPPVVVIHTRNRSTQTFNRQLYWHHSGLINLLQPKFNISHRFIFCWKVGNIMPKREIGLVSGWKYSNHEIVPSIKSLTVDSSLKPLPVFLFSGEDSCYNRLRKLVIKSFYLFHESLFISLHNLVFYNYFIWRKVLYNGLFSPTNVL